MTTNTAIKQKTPKDSVEVRFAKLETTLPHLATKAELKEEISNVRNDIANVKTELKQDIANVRTEVANVRTDLKDAINNQTKWFAGFLLTILVAVIGIFLKLSSH
ncbi:hypothetical protein [Candidatus Liberibacter brunswickensis]|uniref:hypothetical protein n=1 Tax=Candidatus Liberibacter brunswickensis TaxID=1968796 RepID=UPI002FDF2322